MTKLFLVILNMSITGSFVILAVILSRILLKRSPRIYSYLLWAVVMVRLVCPFAVRTSFGIIPNTWIINDVQEEDVQVQEDRIFAGMAEDIQENRISVGPVGMEEDALPEGQNSSVLSDSVSVEAGQADISHENTYIGEAAMPDTSGDLLQKGTGESAFLPDGGHWDSAAVLWGISQATWKMISRIWFVGCIALIVYGMISYRRLVIWLGTLKEKPTLLDGCGNCRLVISDQIKTPFTAGFFKPVIYLPEGLKQEASEMILAHEQTHIRRRDYLIKTAAYFITCIHWFNPLVWLSFRLMEADMETSCDEAVLKRIGYDRKKTYAETLLAMSTVHAMEIGTCPLAFGEKNVKSRIKNAVRQKKGKTWIAAVSAVLVCCVAVVLLVNRSSYSYKKEDVLVVQEENETVGDERITMSGTLDGEISASETLNDSVSDGSTQNDGTLNDSTQNGDTSDGSTLNNNTPENTQLVQTGEGKEEENSTQNDPSLEMNSPEYGEVYGDPEDHCSVLLRNPVGNYQEYEILYSYPLYGIANTGNQDELAEVRITSNYGTRYHPIQGTSVFHSGIDFGAALGTPIYAAADGIVLESGTDEYCGIYVILLHANGELTYYAHCDRILVESGQEVMRGEQIATVGNTGTSTGPHLHFAVSRNGSFKEPEFTTAFSIEESNETPELVTEEE